MNKSHALRRTDLLLFHICWPLFFFIARRGRVVLVACLRTNHKAEPQSWCECLGWAEAGRQHQCSLEVTRHKRWADLLLICVAGAGGGCGVGRHQPPYHNWKAFWEGWCFLFNTLFPLRHCYFWISLSIWRHATNNMFMPLNIIFKMLRVWVKEICVVFYFNFSYLNSVLTKEVKLWQDMVSQRAGLKKSFFSVGWQKNRSVACSFVVSHGHLCWNVPISGVWAHLGKNGSGIYHKGCHHVNRLG